MEDILNSLFEKTLIIPFLTGAIFVIAGLIMLRFPPKEINYLYGYRTRSSMKNQQVWDFSQKYSSLKMMQCGCVLVVVSLTNLFFDFSETVQVSVGFSLVILSCAVLFLTTESAIRKKFPNS